MPVATKGSVKLVSMEELKRLGTQCFISNSYVFSLRPGLSVVKRAGGLHKFVGWKGSIFTDSGGFQMVREQFFQKIDDSGVTFRNPFDSALDHLSPEKAMLIQNSLGSDVAMCLDDVPAFGSSLARLSESVDRTFAWGKRCIDAHRNKKQLLFGICQGGTDAKMRQKSAELMNSLPFDGLALGGLAFGESMHLTEKMVKIDTRVLDASKTRYLMGVGTPQEMLFSVSLGVDCFDSAFPTQVGRHGTAFSRQGRMNISNAKFRFDLKPLDAHCSCVVCESHSRAYLHHLFRTGEENGQKYLSLHNVAFVHEMLSLSREAIDAGRFERFAKGFLKRK